MSTLVLVRHAQARAFETVSERVSGTGEPQDILLGESWRARAAKFDEVYAGPFLRHTRTAELAGFDKFERREEFNEYDAGRILGALADYAPPRDNRELQNMFERAMPLWIKGELRAPGLESCQPFRERRTRALRAITDPET